jgi:hypothetical protein
LSGASGLYPECLNLKGIEIIGEAIIGDARRGGFADVFKGRLRDQVIAVKVLRVYQEWDIEKLLKVMLMYAIFDNVKWVPFPGIVF